MKFLSSVAKEIKKLFSGRDGELSLRRITGGIVTIVGIVELFRAEAPVANTLVALAWSLRGLIAIGLAMVLYGIITAQNVKDIVNKSPNPTPVVEDDGK
jgi:hypothetical protein